MQQNPLGAAGVAPWTAVERLLVHQLVTLWDTRLSGWKLGWPLLLDERVANRSHWLTLWEPSLVKDKAMISNWYPVFSVMSMVGQKDLTYLHEQWGPAYPVALAMIFTETAENVPALSFYIRISVVQLLLGLPQFPTGKYPSKGPIPGN